MTREGTTSSPQDSIEKLGLCLSGGGFRAALFHIGVLGKLAERQLLHKVEVLSTVSGGSLIGACYYLKVKQLLEGRRPGCPTPAPAHYLDIVLELENEFWAVVQHNIRLRLFLNPIKTGRMLLDETYSRSDRLAELLDDELFAPLAQLKRLPLKAIHIQPADAGQYASADGTFSVKAYNRAEECKIPVLTINATSLNTGHPFHFTGSWVGEPDRNGQYVLEQNSNVVLEQLRFDGYFQRDVAANLPSPPTRRIADWQQRTLDCLTLADAVAASAAVPGIFPPLPIHGLYRNSQSEEIVLELSDGGVFDNQGVDALLAANCSHVIVSDACGQLEDERLLATDTLNTVLRASDVMMERIRGNGYFDLWMRVQATPTPAGSQTSAERLTQAGFVRSGLFMHLREEAKNLADQPALPGPGNAPDGIVYRLSGLRTDFDSFSDLEIASLMYHGYTLTRDKVQTPGLPPATPLTAPKPWRFQAIAPLIRQPAGLNRLYTHLKAGKKQFGRAFVLSPVPSTGLAILLAIALLAWPAWWMVHHWNDEAVPAMTAMRWSDLIPAAIQAVAVAAAVLLPLLPSVRDRFKTVAWLRQIKLFSSAPIVAFALRMISAVFAVVLSVAIFIWLKSFDRIFLKAGRL